MKKIISIVLAAAMMFCLLTACGDSTSTGAVATGASSGAAASAASGNASKIKIGVILVGDETEGYTKAHMDGIDAARQSLGLSEDQVIYMKSIPESSECYDTAIKLIKEDGCSAIFSNSYGHQNYMVQAAQENPDVTFVSMTGDFAAISGCKNMKNAFTDVYQSRYVSGVVAGMKIKELADAGKLTDANKDENGNVKVGYVGAFNYAEVVSGYTAFYLGIKSVYPQVTMYVDYTQSWFDVDKEAAMAEKFIGDGCVIIGQHADSTGAPSACEAAFKAGTTVYSVGYNVDMLDVAPDVALTSASNNWSVYYTYAFKCLIDGTDIKTDWAEGYDTDAVKITKLGTACAEGTQEKVDETIKGLKDGSIKVFDTSTFTVSSDNIAATLKASGAKVTCDSGNKVTSCQIDLSYYDFSTGTPTLVYQGQTIEAIVDGAFSESTFRSAPYFSIRIDGINEAS
ncbi:MAG: BMP family ABC transporter substrate-binding protein [Lachnospiraceae bacterium]|jgi:basic membrane protein A|nr:BMP family ABC transporter substrate-binding protein [Lachnospiraceae bacterium]